MPSAVGMFFGKVLLPITSVTPILQDFFVKIITSNVIMFRNVVLTILVRFSALIASKICVTKTSLTYIAAFIRHLVC